MSKEIKNQFAVGDIVRHTATFCQAIAWSTPPVNGRVTSIEGCGWVDEIVRVEWSDGSECGILAGNIEEDMVSR